MLQLANPLFGTSSVLIMDSGFYVVKVLVELQKRGMFVGILIKKQCYWPHHVPGDRMVEHFDNLEIGKEVDYDDCQKSRIDPWGPGLVTSGWALWLETLNTQDSEQDK